MASIIKRLGLQNASVGADPYCLRAPKKVAGLFGINLLNFGTSRRRQPDRTAARNSRPGNDQPIRPNNSFGKKALSFIAAVLIELLVIAKDLLVETGRCYIYCFRRRMAVVHAASNDPEQRAFGRATLDYCAAHLRRRTNRFLVPGKRTAQRLVRCAIAATETALTAHDVSDAEGARWISTLAKSVDVRLLVAGDDGNKPSTPQRAPRAAAATQDDPQPVFTHRSTETPDSLEVVSPLQELEGTRLQRRPFPGRVERATEYIPVQPVQHVRPVIVSEASSNIEEPPPYMMFDEEPSDDVIEFLLQERDSQHVPLEGHDGFA